jgi:hypothetical protein
MLILRPIKSIKMSKSQKLIPINLQSKKWFNIGNIQTISVINRTITSQIIAQTYSKKLQNLIQIFSFKISTWIKSIKFKKNRNYLRIGINIT